MKPPPRAHAAPTDLARAEVGGILTLPEAAARRFSRVLRLSEGAAVEVFDGAARVVRGTLVGADGLAVTAVHQASDALPPLVLAQALAKGDKLELVLQKATELGASAILLFESARTVVKLADDRAEKRIERFVRICDDAARQSGRERVPDVVGPMTVAALCEWLRAFDGVRGVGVPTATEPLSHLLHDVRAERGFCFVVGPEGGLTEGEVAALTQAEARPVRLGAHVLRTETAGLAALAVYQARLGLM